MEDTCIICCDEKNVVLNKVSCLVCKFSCCSSCYNKLQSVLCPNCRDDRFNIKYFYTVIQQYNQVNSQLNTRNIILSNFILQHKFTILLLLYIILILLGICIFLFLFMSYKLLF